MSKFVRPDAVSLGLRLATTADAAMLLAWRNDPLTRQQSRSTELVALGQHIGWLESVLADAGRRLFVGEVGGVAVGTGRLDVLPDARVEVSWTIAPEHRGRGLGTALVAALVAAAQREFPGATLYAEIKDDNAPSQAVATRAGFQLEESVGGMGHYRRHAHRATVITAARR